VQQHRQAEQHRRQDDRAADEQRPAHSMRLHSLWQGFSTHGVGAPTLFGITGRKPVPQSQSAAVASAARGGLHSRGVGYDLSRFEAVLLDLDGTVYHEHHPLPGAVELIRKLKAEGRNFACLSNSASSPRRVSERLATMGVEVEPERIYTAAAAACDYALEKFAGTTPRVFNLCTESVREMLEGKVQWVNRDDEACDVVIAGAPSNVHATDERQRIALQLLRHGAALVGICNDRVYPSPRGMEFGAGAMSAMLSYASHVTPFFCGKPEKIFFTELCHRLKVDPARCVLIGDNIESDVIGAKNVGMFTILTLSGVTRRRDLEQLPANLRPNVILENLTEL
jgi:NagD protein